ncbi:hypothetical protein [Methylobacterium nodulans]|uniref:Uncharacterized protein n=1 Tax=Methylobacterium nodulans (strain LMG 21967 / CNCM I-2342 / ORS 2060) TaxID=460265 RepID=B8IGK6_METNO|nr:hypothetical protein [Methylobacterium nodulans]ACL55906.1 conserved hypothetical protein [Methylobacterium nodulans ORS 2060]
MSKQLPTEPASPRQPTKHEKQAIERARKRHQARPAPLAYELEIKPGNELSLGAPHADEAGQYLRLIDTFGTASDNFARHMLGWLGAAVREPGKSAPTPQQLNAGLAAVAGISPRDEVEAMLAVQMVATNEAAMSMLGQARSAADPAVMERFGTLATKLQRTLIAQAEALAKLRRGGEQTVRVEHVHVYAGGQAIVGAVSATPGGRGAIEMEHQAHATDPRALAHAPGASMRCPDETRVGLPVTGREGADAMPHARRRSRKRRA